VLDGVPYAGSDVEAGVGDLHGQARGGGGSIKPLLDATAFPRSALPTGRGRLEGDGRNVGKADVW